MGVRGFCVFLFLGFASSCQSPPYQLNPVKVQTDEHVRDLARTSADEPIEQFISKASRFRSALKATTIDPDMSGPATNYLRAGVTVADLYCRSYFQKLQSQRSNMEALRGTTNITDATISALLGLSGASADAVAGSSVFFSALEAQYENLDAAYLVSPEVEQVEKLVFEARDRLHTEIFKDSGPSNYYEAERRLAAYHNLCTFTGVKRLVNDAIAAGNPIVKTGDAARARLNALAAQAPLQALSELLAKDSVQLNSGDAVALWSYYFGKGGSDDVIQNAVFQTIQFKLQVTDAAGVALSPADGTFRPSAVQTLDNRRALASANLASLDVRFDLESEAEKFELIAHERKKTLDKAKTEAPGICTKINTAATKEEGESERDTWLQVLYAFIAKADADAIFACPADGGLAAIPPATPIEIQPPETNGFVNDSVNLTVIVE